MRPYAAILSARLRALLQYRAAALAGMGTQVFWGLIRMMIFSAFYAHAVAAAMPMSQREVIAYVWLSQAFFAMFPLRADPEVSAMIRSGNVAYELLRPVDLYAMWLSRSIAARLAPTALRAVPILTLATLAGWLYWPGPAGAAACAASVLAAALLSSAIATLMTVTMFWTISGTGISTLISMTAYLLGGMIIPLPLFPDWLQPVLEVLPFRGLIDTPFRLFVGHIPLARFPAVLAHQLAWITGIVLVSRWMLGRLVRKLIIQGG